MKRQGTAVTTATESEAKTAKTKRGTSTRKKSQATKKQSSSQANGNGASPDGRGKKLVIVESPAKARTVSNILGDEYRVIASVGHVRDLHSYGYGLEDFQEFKPKYVVVKDKGRGVDKSEIISEIAEAAKQADVIYLSTDPDREGEAIAWHIQEAAGIPEEKTSRVVFHEITKPAIEEAFEHPGKLNRDLIDAQQTRRVLDRLIGYPLTWFVQNKVTKSASAGRVQSVALRLVVNREREIQDFVPQEYWTIHALLAAQQAGPREAAQFEANLARLPGEKGKPNIADGDTAQRLIDAFNRSTFTVSRVKHGERKQSPAPPFTTSTLQQAANNRLNMGASQTMNIAQQLYEGVEIPGEGPVGLITYMRTDSLNIAPAARNEARNYAERTWGKDYLPEKERVYRTRSKGAQEAHEAVRPTSAVRTPDSLKNVLQPQQLRLYRLIWERFMASQLADARYNTLQIDIDAKENGEQRGTFRASARELAFAGHLRVYGAHESEKDASPNDDEDEQEGKLPELTEGQELDRRNVEGKQHFTEPPPRYTEASLVKALEELGIGRPSTYATIVQTVQKRDYVRKEGRALVPQELGFVVNDLLVDHLDEYVTPDFTSKLEDQLDEIAEGKAEYLPTVRDFWGRFEKDIEEAKATAPKQTQETDIRCNVCEQANMVIRWGPGGTKFLGCPRYPECKNAMPMTEEGQPMERATPEEIDIPCPLCGNKLIRKTGPYGPYVDCVKRDSEECTFRASAPVGVACPECEKYGPLHGELVEKKTRRGTFYGCWNYPDCSYTTQSLEPEKLSRVRPKDERDEANRKLKERSERGKRAYAKRRANQQAQRNQAAS